MSAAKTRRFSAVKWEEYASITTQTGGVSVSICGWTRFAYAERYSMWDCGAGAITGV